MGSAPIRGRSSRLLLRAVGLALPGLVLLAATAGAAQLDTVTATGTAPWNPGQVPFPVQYTEVAINAQSGTSGENPTGTASFTLVSPAIPGSLMLGGPVTCLHVLGADQGAGTSASPTTAVLTFRNTTTSTFSFISVTLVDNGEGSADTISSGPVSTPDDCSQPFTGSTGTFSSGGAVVFDAPVLPTSKDQCKDGGWQSSGVFKNEGDCVSFVATHGKNPPG